MNTAIIHTVSGPHPSSHSVSAPGWVPTAQVMEATGLLPQSPAPSACTWSEWVSTYPVTVDACGLSLLTPDSPTPAGHARLIVRSGPESGFAIALPQGEWTLGRGQGADVDLVDPYLSRRPLLLSNGPAGIHVGGRPLGTTGHEYRAGTPHPNDATRCVIGSTTVELSRTSSAPTADDVSQTRTQSSAEHLVWPEPEPVAPVRTPSWLVYAAPIAIGVALALIIGTWWFLLLSLAGPATATLTLRAERRRYIRESAQAKRALRSDITQVLAELDALVQSYVHGLGAEAYSAAESPSTPADRREVLVLGTGSNISTVGVRLPRDRHARNRARRRLPAHHLDGDTAFLIADDAPLLVDRRLPVRVRGPQARARSIVRALVAAHLAAGSGCRADAGFPEFAGLRNPASECVVTRSSPTTSRSSPLDQPNPPGQDCYTVSGPQAADEAVLDIRCGGSDWPDDIRVPDPRTVNDVIGGTVGSAPRIGVTGRGSPVSGHARIHAVSTATFLRLLATIGPRAESTGNVLPPAAAIPTTPVSDVLRQWEAAGSHRSGPLSVPIGLTVARPEPLDDRRNRSLTASTPLPPMTRSSDPLFLLDLRASGPHALVAGTTGSGKSVLLETWLEGLCRTHSADDLRLVLLDFKGGASLSRFLTHPHTDCVVTDLDEAAALRAVRSITAEITRRERHLAESECRDLDHLLTRANHDPSVTPLPRLLVVIDEFHVLTSLSPHIVTEFEHLTAVGRSLGVHIVLATQRPSGVVSARMRANIALRICLRVRDEADSQEVLGIPDAAWIDTRVPGTALVSDDSGVHATRSAVPDEPEHIQSNLPQVTMTSLTGTAAAVLPLPCEPPSLPSAALGPPGPRHEVIAPPLPTQMIAGTPLNANPLVFGLVDLPDENRVAPALISASSGSVTVSGGRGRGWSTAVDALAAAFHTAGLPVIHLSPHAGLPSVDPDGILRLGHSQAWLIDHLIGLCDTRREPVVWAIDDWDEFVNAHQTSPRVDRLERLLTGSAGMRFIVSGHRRLLAQRLSQIATTRIVFPPASDTDAVFFGLAATRFTGEWPPGRAVILGEESLTDGREGADLQISQGSAAPENKRPPVHRPHPFWNDFGKLGHVAESEQQHTAPSKRSIPVGVDPAGTAIMWDPSTDGVVLTVLVESSSRIGGSSDPTLLTRFAEDLRARDVTVVLDSADPGQREAADAAVSVSKPVCLVAEGLISPSTPTRSAPLGDARTALPPSSVHGPDTRGPVLLFGAWHERALRAAGFRGCPPIPRAAAASWWVSGDSVIPVRICTPQAPHPSGHQH